jgi:hypothetical protein
MSRTSVRIAVAATATAVALLLSGCDTLLGIDSSTESVATPTSTPTPTQTCSNYGFESVFSAYGSVHYTRELADNLTMYIDMWTEQKTHEWYPEAEKKLNFVINVLDTNAEEDDAFKLKRKVYMSELVLDANTVTPSGTSEVAFSMDVDPIEATLDPEALSSKYGLLITSPKGGFQKEDNTIGTVAAETIGMNMDFQLTLSTQTKAGKSKYKTRVYTVELPVAIFHADTDPSASTSCATNATLAPVTN